jgi:hypothetical protein
MVALCAKLTSFKIGLIVKVTRWRGQFARELDPPEENGSNVNAMHEGEQREE